MKRLLLFLLLVSAATAQRVEIREAPELVMPGRVDSNSPVFYINGQFHLVNSTGGGPPLISRGANQFTLNGGESGRIVTKNPWPAWLESAWVDPAGTVIAWYHQEHEWVCGVYRPAQPHIGVALSYDGGKTFQDQGTILSSGDPLDCSSKNGYFAGGHGDFSVILDRENKYFYFLFGNYAGPLETQGVAIARMKYEDRFNQPGRVWKYHQGGWGSAGISGRTTPVFPAVKTWQAADTDSFWGPAVHWNTHLNQYVVLLNRSCCEPGFPQEGIYAAYADDISDPPSWSAPEKILDDRGWYPQIIGVEPGESDTLAGQTARLYIYGNSKWEIVFHRSDAVEAGPNEPMEPEPDPDEPVRPRDSAGTPISPRPTQRP